MIHVVAHPPKMPLTAVKRPILLSGLTTLDLSLIGSELRFVGPQFPCSPQPQQYTSLSVVDRMPCSLPVVM